MEKRARGKFIYFLLFFAFASLRVVCAFGGFYEKLPCFPRTHSQWSAPHSTTPFLPHPWPKHAPNLTPSLGPALAAIYICAYITSSVLLFALLVLGNFGV